MNGVCSTHTHRLSPSLYLSLSQHNTTHNTMPTHFNNNSNLNDVTDVFRIFDIHYEFLSAIALCAVLLGGVVFVYIHTYFFSHSRVISAWLRTKNKRELPAFSLCCHHIMSKTDTHRHTHIHAHAHNWRQYLTIQNVIYYHFSLAVVRVEKSNVPLLLSLPSRNRDANKFLSLHYY